MDGKGYFDPEAKVREVWIDGRNYHAQPAKEPKAAKAEEAKAENAEKEAKAKAEKEKKEAELKELAEEAGGALAAGRARAAGESQQASFDSRCDGLDLRHQRDVVTNSAVFSSPTERFER